MTQSAKRLAFALVVIWLIGEVFVSGRFDLTGSVDKDAYKLGGVIGSLFGALVLGSIVTWVIRIFSKNKTFYEIWFASSLIFLTLGIIAELVVGRA